MANRKGAIISSPNIESAAAPEGLGFLRDVQATLQVRLPLSLPNIMTFPGTQVMVGLFR